MLRALILALGLAPTALLAQSWPADAPAAPGTVLFDGPGSGVHVPGGYSGLPPSPQRGAPAEVLPRHRYDPAFPTRGLPIEGGGVPVFHTTPDASPRLLDRADIEAMRAPPPVPAPGDEASWMSGTPYVVDGDSFGLNGELVRLAGIDAPEVDQLCYRGNIPHRCGIDARAWLAERIEDTRVDCRIHYRDAAQRLVSTCWMQGQDIGGWAARNGWALVWAGAPSPYGGVEEAARTAGLGVWAFDFRHPSEWRTIMDDTRRQADARITNGTDAPTLPFPYAPFTERRGMHAPAPTYTIAPR